MQVYEPVFHRLLSITQLQPASPSVTEDNSNHPYRESACGMFGPRFADPQPRAIDVIYTANSQVADDWIERHIIKNECRFVGIDLEWKPNRRVGENNPAAVLQISTRSHCLVWHLNGWFSPNNAKSYRFRFASHIASSQYQIIRNLMEFLQSGLHWKVGVNVQEDLLKLHADAKLPHPPNNHLELGMLATRHYQRCLEQYFGAANRDLLERLVRYELIFMSRGYLSKLYHPPYNFPQLQFFDVVHWDLGYDCHDPGQELFDIRNQIGHLKRLVELLETRVGDPKTVISNSSGKNTNESRVHPFPVDMPDTILVPMLTKMAKTGLNTLASRYLCCDLPKNRRITMSNWEEFPLTDRQVEYAALDAWISTEVVECIRQKDPQLIHELS